MKNVSNTADTKRSQFLLVKYEKPQRAQKALNHFHDAYLPEYKKDIMVDSTSKSPYAFKLEDGWLAYQLIGKYIAIVFESPDQESAKQIIQENKSEFNVVD